LINVRALLWRGSLLALVVAAAFVASPDHPVSAATVALSVGSSHTCAVTTSGGLKCWGENSHGQLGDGTTTDSSTPVAVSGLGSGVAVVSVGSSHSCVLTTAGAVKCWGENSDGRLGDGTTTDRSTPVSVSGLTVGVVAVSVGSFHACALTKAGGVKCWGRNSDGRLGDETTTDRNRPVEASGLSSSVTAAQEAPARLRPGSALPPSQRGQVTPAR
jgi:alpha-tubulin suppressor-like RCC1 family protein